MAPSTTELSALQALTQAFTAPGTVAAISAVEDGRILAMSPSFESLHGIPIERVTGHSAVELGLWRDAAQREGVITRLRQRGSVIAEPVSMRSPSGRHLDGLMSCALIESSAGPCLFSLIQDIRSYGSEEAARSREHASFRPLIMASEVGVYRRRLRPPALVDVNPAAAQMLGFLQAEALIAASAGQSSFSYVEPSHAEWLAEQLRAHGRVSHVRAEIRRADGGSVWVSESARAVRDSSGELSHVEGTLVDITVQVQAEQALMQSENLYRNLVENSRDGVFLMQHGKVEFANEALAGILGCRVEDLIGQSYFDWVAPEDQAEQAARRQAREAGSMETQLYEILLRRRDGRKRLCAVRAGAVVFRGEPASIGTLRDVTDERASQRQLAEAEERYRLLFRHAVLGMFRATLDGRLIEANEAMARLFGWESPEAMCAGLESMVAVYVDGEARKRAIETILRDGRVVGWEFELQRRDGSRFHALSSARLLLGEDGSRQIEGSLLDISARRHAEQELSFLAHHDSLTQLANRRSFETALDEALRQLREDRGSRRAMLLMDLDRFKLVNDSLGHAAGDELLLQLAGRLQRTLGHRAMLARYGGDEFALLSFGALEREGAIALAETIRSATSEPFEVRGQQVFSGASVGIVLVDGDYQSPEEVLRDADTAMFRAKGSGGGHVLFDQAMHTAARERLALETDLRLALERGELVAWYQPIVSLASRRIIGVEALLRWEHPQRGLLLPGQFLDIAAETGMLARIDLATLDRSLIRFQQWQRAYGAQAPRRLSVNISDQLFVAPGFPGQVAAALGRSGIDPRQLYLEITETVFRGAAGSLRRTLSQLKALGVRLVVDDFGTGYSSLVSFSESDFDGLKIDRGFVVDLDSNPRHRAIVRTIAQFAQVLDLSVVAEGVENALQGALLRELGCERAQGHFLGAPMPAGDLEALLAAQQGAGDAA